MTISSSEADLRAALLRGVVGRSGPVVPDAETWEQWASLARIERVVPLLHELVDTVPTDLSDEQRTRIHFRQVDAMSHVVRLEHQLVRVADLLAGQGIRSAVLKGVATAHLDYPDPSWRDFADIDLLIDPGDRRAAIGLLARAGWAQRYALPKGHDEYTHALTLVGDHGTELDLHQRIAHRALGLLVPTPVLLEESVPFELGGTQVRALAPGDRLIHSAIHAVTSRGPNRRLSTVADVLLGATGSAHAAHEVLARAERWQVRSLVERAICDAFAVAQLTVDRRWAAAMRRPTARRDRLVERAYLGPARRPVVEELAYLRLLPRWSDRGRYVSGYFATEPDYASQHGRSGLRAQVAYLVSKLRPNSR